MSGKNFIIFGIVTLLLILGLSYLIFKPSDTSTVPQDESMLVSEQEEKDMPVTEKSNLKQYESAPQMQLVEGKDYKAIIKTSVGDITVDLFEKESPNTVNNFVFLAKEGFYNGVIFHRVIKDFMIQGGDPMGIGVGGPGYQFEDEFNNEKLVQGSLAMANSGPNTNGSQFFIVTAKETPWLDGKHTNFGIVTDGLDVVLKIEDVPTDTRDKPVQDVVINSVEIIEE